MDLASALTPLTLGVTMFVSTNVDDILLLAAFFASRLATRTIVLGQLLGIGMLVAASAAAAAAAVVVPPRWVALLGIIPLVLGVREALRLRAGHTDDDDDDGSAKVVHARRQLVAVATVTVANGGDNFAIYVPVFANDLSAVPLYAGIFGVMTLVWCAIGHALVNNPAAGERFRSWGRVLLPVVLIGLGLWLLAGAVFLEGAQSVALRDLLLVRLDEARLGSDGAARRW
jgi:cadmium resistance protein CadD (predicted permease)